MRIGIGEDREDVPPNLIETNAGCNRGGVDTFTDRRKGRWDGDMGDGDMGDVGRRFRYMHLNRCRNEVYWNCT